MVENTSLFCQYFVFTIIISKSDFVLCLSGGYTPTFCVRYYYHVKEFCCLPRLWRCAAATGSSKRAAFCDRDRVAQESRIPKRDGNGRADSLPTSRFSARAAVMLLRRNVPRQLCVKGIIDARAPTKKERTKSTKSFSNSITSMWGKKNNVLGGGNKMLRFFFYPKSEKWPACA
jgi:hypothetical protein